MKRMPAFLLICVFAVLFIVSFLYPTFAYVKVINITGQIGIALGLALFFILPADKKPPKR